MGVGIPTTTYSNVSMMTQLKTIPIWRQDLEH